MMATNGFNIFDYVDEFKKAGMPHEQADLLAKALHSLASEGVATERSLELAKLELKHDIADLKRDIKELDAKIEIVRAGLEEKIEGMRIGLKKDMAIIMGSYSFLILGTLVTLAKFGLLTPTP